MQVCQDTGSTSSFKLPEAPCFRPTKQEWEDPIRFITSIRSVVEPYGLCKIIPPQDWKPTFSLDKDNIRFPTRKQLIHELQDRARLSAKEQTFTSEYTTYSKAHGHSIPEEPALFGHEINLFALFNAVEKRGGYEVVTSKQQWGDIADLLKISHLHTSVANAVRQLYQRYLLNFEKHEQAKRCTERCDDETGCEPPKKRRKSERSSERGQKSKKLEESKKSEEIRVPENIDNLACELCCGGAQEEFIMLCDRCDKGFHTFCLSPPLSEVPEGDWICPVCLKEDSEKFAFKPGLCCSWGEFEVVANRFRKGYWGGEQAANKVTYQELEQAFWRIVEEGDEHIEVFYGADLDSGRFGSGFEKGACRDPTQLDKWNLNNLPRQDGSFPSVLRFIEDDVSGVIVPWLYIGMMFSAFCWHVEDHLFYSANFLHYGAPKRWYSVPFHAMKDFEAAFQKTVPDQFAAQPDLLFQLITTLSPRVLLEHNVPVCTLVQEEGQMVVSFPGAYHAGFNHGFNCAEAVNFVPSDWFQYAEASAERYRRFRKPSVVSQEELVLKCALNDPSPHSAVWISQELRRMINEEAELRYKCWERGVKKSAAMNQAESTAANTGSEPEECCVCRQYLYLSAVQCECAPTRKVCLHHAEHLCDCPAHKNCLWYRYSLQELEDVWKKSSALATNAAPAAVGSGGDSAMGITRLGGAEDCAGVGEGEHTTPMDVEANAVAAGAAATTRDSTDGGAAMPMELTADVEARPMELDGDRAVKSTVDAEEGCEVGMLRSAHGVEGIEDGVKSEGPVQAAQDAVGEVQASGQQQSCEGTVGRKQDGMEPEGDKPGTTGVTPIWKSKDESEDNLKSILVNKVKDDPAGSFTGTQKDESASSPTGKPAGTPIADPAGSPTGTPQDEHAGKPKQNCPDGVLVTPRKSVDTADTDTGKCLDASAGKKKLEDMQVSGVHGACAAGHATPGCQHQFDYSPKVASLQKKYQAKSRTWRLKVEGMLKRGNAKLSEVDQLLLDAQQYAWGFGDVEECGALQRRLNEARTFVNDVTMCVRGKCSLEQALLLVAKDPPPVIVPSLGKLKVAVSQAQEVQEKLRKVISGGLGEAGVVELEVCLSEASRLCVSVPETMQVEQHLKGIRGVERAVKAVLNKASKQPVPVAEVKSAYTQVLNVHPNMPQAATLKAMLDEAELWQAKVKAAVASQPTLQDIQTLIKEGEELKVGAPELAGLRTSLKRSKAWVEEAQRALSNPQANLAAMKVLLLSGESLSVVAPELEHIRTQVRKGEWKERVQQVYQARGSVAAAEQLLLEAEKWEVEDEILVADLRGKLEGARSWAKRVEEVLHTDGEDDKVLASLTDLQDLLASSRSLALKPDQTTALELLLQQHTSWSAAAAGLLARIAAQTGPDIATVRAALVAGKDLKLSLPEVGRLEAVVQAADSWNSEADRVLRGHADLPSLQSLYNAGLAIGVALEGLPKVQATMKALQWEQEVRSRFSCVAGVQPEGEGGVQTHMEHDQKPSLGDAILCVQKAGELPVAATWLSALQAAVTSAQSWLTLAQQWLQLPPSARDGANGVRLLEQGRRLPLAVDIMQQLQLAVEQNQVTIAHVAQPSETFKAAECVPLMKGSGAAHDEGRPAAHAAATANEARQLEKRSESWMERCRQLVCRKGGAADVDKGLKALLQSVKHAVDALKSLGVNLGQPGQPTSNPSNPTLANGERRSRRAKSHTTHPVNKPHCVCQRPDNGTAMMLTCSSCDEWYHPKCVGQVPGSKAVKSWQCPLCAWMKSSRTLPIPLAAHKASLPTLSDLRALLETAPRTGDVPEVQTLQEVVNAVNTWQVQVQKVLFNQTTTESTPRCITEPQLRDLFKQACAMDLNTAAVREHIVKLLPVEAWRSRALATWKAGSRPAWETISKIVEDAVASGVTASQDSLAHQAFQLHAATNTWDQQRKACMVDLKAAVKNRASKEQVNKLRDQAAYLAEQAPSSAVDLEDELQELAEAAKLYCLCEQLYDENRSMLSCDYCENWFHHECVGLDPPQIHEEAPEDFRCPACSAAAGVSYPELQRMPAGLRQRFQPSLPGNSPATKQLAAGKPASVELHKHVQPQPPVTLSDQRHTPVQQQEPVSQHNQLHAPFQQAAPVLVRDQLHVPGQHQAPVILSSQVQAAVQLPSPLTLPKEPPIVANSAGIHAESLGKKMVPIFHPGHALQWTQAPTTATMQSLVPQPLTPSPTGSMPVQSPLHAAAASIPTPSTLLCAPPTTTICQLPQSTLPVSTHASIQTPATTPQPCPVPAIPLLQTQQVTYSSAPSHPSVVPAPPLMQTPISSNPAAMSSHAPSAPAPAPTLMPSHASLGYTTLPLATMTTPNAAPGGASTQPLPAVPLPAVLPQAVPPMVVAQQAQQNVQQQAGMAPCVPPVHTFAVQPLPGQLAAMAPTSAPPSMN